tara:strand:- start:33 stop:224 length:192 start_codon:yes stop_codon:yes gene_type:complete
LKNEKRPTTKEKLKSFSQEFTIFISWPKTPNNPKNSDGSPVPPLQMPASCNETKSRSKNFLVG